MEFKDIEKKELIELGLFPLRGYLNFRDKARLSDNVFEVWQINDKKETYLFPLFFKCKEHGEKKEHYEVIKNPYEVLEFLRQEKLHKWDEEKIYNRFGDYNLSKYREYCKSKYSVMHSTLELIRFAKNDIDIENCKLIECFNFENIPREYIEKQCGGVETISKMIWLQEYLKGNVEAPYKKEEDHIYNNELYKRELSNLKKLLEEKQKIINRLEINNGTLRKELMEKTKEINRLNSLVSDLKKFKMNLKHILEELDMD